MDWFDTYEPADTTNTGGAARLWNQPDQSTYSRRQHIKHENSWRKLCDTSIVLLRGFSAPVSETKHDASGLTPTKESFPHAPGLRADLKGCTSKLGVAPIDIPNVKHQPKSTSPHKTASLRPRLRTDRKSFHPQSV